MLKDVVMAKDHGSPSPTPAKELNGHSEQVRRALYFARYEANKLGISEIDSEHLLLGLWRLGDETVDGLLTRFQITPEKIREEVGGTRPNPGIIASSVELPLSEDCWRILEAAEREGQTEAFPIPGPLRLILGIVQVESCRAAEILRQHGLDAETARREIRALRALWSDETEDRDLPLLSQYGRDLTAIAARDGFDPLIGRERELSHVAQILCQRLRSNPILVGDPGIGKTALVQGLAQRIVEGQVAGELQQKRLVALDLSLIVAGAKYRGEFEERLKGILDELRRNPDRIVFIDEIHTLVGTGGAEGTLDAANILKPPLSNGEVSCIGATTSKEYRQYIEKDRALARRFQAVKMDPPTPSEALAILAGVKGRYEDFHNVTYSDEALRAAVYQSQRYISDRHLPDKAIDMIDQTGARVKLRHATVQLGSAPGATTVTTLRSTPIPVTRDDVEDAIAFATGIPVTRLKTGEAEKLSNMEATLGERVIGQDDALAAISRAIRRSRLGVRNPRRPIGSFFFVGPSGVGKTETARRLAEFLFDRDDALVRFDMSEYMERHAVAKLIGSPPGYVGYQEGGQLTEAVRRQPYSVVLFDEIEKAHPDIANILLQILEDGRLTDSDGRAVDFTNAVVLMTSNVGTKMLATEKTIGFAGETGKDRGARFDRLRSDLSAELKRVFSPEFLNRLDEIVVFNPLENPELRVIVDLLLDDLDAMLSDREVRVAVSDEVKDWVLSLSEVDSTTGARPLRRAIQRWIHDPVSEELIRHDGQGPSIIEITLEDGDIRLNLRSAEFDLDDALAGSLPS